MSGSSRARPAALAFMLVVVVLDMVALGVTTPVLPRLIERFAGGAASAGVVNGLSVAVFSAMQFLCSPIQGSLSDRFGRRPVVLLSVTGLGLDYVLMALAPNLGWLFVGRVISGAAAATVSTTYAYIADVVPATKRAGAYGLIGAAFGLGFILGPAIGGLLGDVDPRAPFWASAGLCALAAIYGLVVLPESLPRERRTAFSWRRASPVGALRLLASRGELAGLACVNALGQFANGAMSAVFVLYAAHRYGWSARMTGVSLAAIGLGAALVQGGLTAWVVRRLGERATMIFALAFGALGFVIYGLAPTGAIFLVGVPVMSLWGMAGPSSLALMTRLVGPADQGQLQGANMSANAIVSVAAPVLFGAVYSLSVEHGAGAHGGAAFLLGAAILAGAAALAWAVSASARRAA